MFRGRKCFSALGQERLVCLEPLRQLAVLRVTVAKAFFGLVVEYHVALVELFIVLTVAAMLQQESHTLPEIVIDQFAQLAGAFC
jgi:hypothetical protein